MILITGANGMAMNALSYLLKRDLIPFKAFSRKELDVSDSKMITHQLNKFKPNWLVNGAAFTKVDQAEIYKSENKIVNQDSPNLLSKLCLNLNINLLHLSTDYVFDGKKNKPYNENDICNPLSEYGKKKRGGEIAVLKNPNNIVLRTSGLFGKKGLNFVKKIITKASKGETLKVVNDQVFSPTSTFDLAFAIKNIIDRNYSGLIHFTNKGVCSWYQFADFILEEALNQKILFKKPTLIPIQTKDLNLNAKRPLYSVLDCNNYQNFINEKRNSWFVSLKKYLSEEIFF